MHNPITILYLIDTWISTPDSGLKGGAENQLYLLASALDSKKFRPIVIQLTNMRSNSLPIAKGRIGKLEVIHLPITRLYGLKGCRQLFRIFKLIQREHVDVVHTFFEKSEVAGYIIKLFLKNLIWITSRRDMGFKRNRIYDLIFRIGIRYCSKCLAVCRAVKDEIVHREKVAGEKIRVIYNGLDLPNHRMPEECSAVKQKLGFESNTTLVGMIANFNHDIKGHHCFLNAAKYIVEQSLNTEFILVGDGPLRGKYEAMARSLKIEKKVHFFGKRNDVQLILKALDISVLSSTSEGLSNVILESMAAGKPVVATDVGGNPEVVADQLTGYLVATRDEKALAGAIVSLLENPEKKKSMGLAGRERVEREFSLRRMVKQYEDIYESLYYKKLKYNNRNRKTV